MKLVFPEITFSAAHYIPGHPKCGCIHGHTYFVRNLEIVFPHVELDETGMILDFGVIKKYFKEYWDHRFLVPPIDISRMPATGLFLKCNIVYNLRPVEPTPTAEAMARLINDDLWSIIEEEVKDNRFLMSFELYEGPNQGVKYP